jgi:hypothetical protein
VARSVRRLGKGNVPAPTLARAGSRCGSHSVRTEAGASPSFLEPASRSAGPFALEPELARTPQSRLAGASSPPHRSRRSPVRSVCAGQRLPQSLSTDSHEHQSRLREGSSHRNGVEWKTFCAMAKAHGEEKTFAQQTKTFIQQVRICRKL